MRIAEEKEKLKKEIEKLKLLRSEIKKSLEFYENAETFSGRCSINDKQILNKSSENVSGTNEDWKNELCKYSGLFCPKFLPSREFIFEFYTFKKNPKKEPYFVQILQEEEEIKLGCWKMPILLDVNDILAKNPIEDFMQVKSFLLLCKHYLHCQENRQTQFNDLKAYVEELKSCSVQANLEIYTCIQLQMFHLQDLEHDKIYHIVLYIIYEMNENRPSDLIIDSIYEEPLPENVIHKLRKFFKIFKHLELRSAFERIVNTNNGEFFQWDGAIENSEEDVQDEENEPEDTDNNNREKIQEKKSSAKKKQMSKKGKSNLQNEEISSDLPKTVKNVKKNLQIEKSRINKNTAKENIKKGGKGKKINETGIEDENKVTRKNKQVRKKIEKSGKQTTLNFSRKDNIEQTEDLDLQSEQLKEQEKDESNQNVAENQSKQKTENKERKIKNTKSKTSNKSKNTFNLANFVLKRKKPNLLTKSSDDNNLNSISKVPNCSTPIPGSSQPNLQMDTALSDIKKLKKRTRISYSSDSELDEVFEEPNKSLINEIEEIQNNLVHVTNRKRKKMTRIKKKR